MHPVHADGCVRHTRTSSCIIKALCIQLPANARDPNITFLTSDLRRAGRSCVHDPVSAIPVIFRFIGDRHLCNPCQKAAAVFPGHCQKLTCAPVQMQRFSAAFIAVRQGISALCQRFCRCNLLAFFQPFKVHAHQKFRFFLTAVRVIRRCLAVGPADFLFARRLSLVCFRRLRFAVFCRFFGFLQIRLWRLAAFLRLFGFLRIRLRRLTAFSRLFGFLRIRLRCLFVFGIRTAVRNLFRSRLRQTAGAARIIQPGRSRRKYRGHQHRHSHQKCQHLSFSHSILLSAEIVPYALCIF